MSFQFINEQFFARSRKTRGCAETYVSTSHKEPRSLTPRLRKRAIYGWKLIKVRQVNRWLPEGSRGQGFKGSSERLEKLGFKDSGVQGFEWSVVSIPSNIKQGYGRKTTVDYIRMLYISYGSVCELETQILLAGDLGFIEKGDLSTAKKDIV